MKTFTSLALGAALGLGLVSAAQAQSTSLSPSVPNPANPFPLNPVATDGTPLPRYNGVGLSSGRSAYVAEDGLVGTGVGTGLGIADDAVGTGLGVVDGVTGAVVR